MFVSELTTPKRKITALGRTDVINRTPMVIKNTMAILKIITGRVGIFPRFHHIGDDLIAAQLPCPAKKRNETIKLLRRKIHDPRRTAAAAATLLARKAESVRPKWFHSLIPHIQ